MTTCDNSTRLVIWTELADQFLDTETRTWIPATAKLLVDAGLSTEQAFAIMHHEVVIVVWPNVWSVAGERAGWDPGLAASAHHPAGDLATSVRRLAYPIYRRQVHAMHENWVAVEQCMQLFAPLDTAAREQRPADLDVLACVGIDSGAQAAADLDERQRHHPAHSAPGPLSRSLFRLSSS